MMKFALLCSGSKGNSFYLKDENTAIMIDCGSTKRYLSSTMETLQIQKEELDALLITHNHTDHISQIKMFSDCKIYSPIEIENIHTIPVHAKEKIQIEHLTITPLALSHDAPSTTGYVIESWQEKLVYITDTGFVANEYLPLLKDADYIVMESNHDVSMLMQTSRPQYVKMRIASDEGHLCNEDCGIVLDRILTKNTKMIVLAHISMQGNTREKALEVNRNMLLQHQGALHQDLMLCAAGQFEVIKGGDWPNEEISYGNVCCAIGMERMANK